MSNAPENTTSTFDPNATVAADTAAVETEAQATEKTFTQAELDRIIDQRLARERKDADKRLAQARAEGKSEAEKLAKMSEAERIEHARKVAEDAANAREAELTKREAELNRRELLTGAATALADKGLPTELTRILELMGTSDADSYASGIKVLEDAFRKAVQEGVEARMSKNSAPLKRSGNTADQTLAQMRKALGLD